MKKKEAKEEELLGLQKVVDEKKSKVYLHIILLQCSTVWPFYFTDINRIMLKELLKVKF